MAMTKSYLSVQVSKSEETIQSDKSATSLSGRGSGLAPRATKGLKTPIRRFFFRFEAQKSNASGIGNKRSRTDEPDVNSGTIMDPLVDTPPLSSDIATSPMSELDTPDAGPHTYDTRSPGQQDTPLSPCMALQNSDHSIDAVVISTLLKLPFCCHEDLLTMPPDRVLEVAHEMNERLPDVLRIDLREPRDHNDIRREVEKLVGIVKSIEKVSVPGAPLKRVKNRGQHELGRVPDVEFLAHLDLRAISPPTSPLAFISETRRRTRVGHADIAAVLSPTKLAMLREEDEDELDGGGECAIEDSEVYSCDDGADIEVDVFHVAKKRRTSISSAEFEMITPTMRRIKVPSMLAKLYDDTNDTSPSQRIIQARPEHKIIFEAEPSVASPSKVIVKTTVIDKSLADTRARYRSSFKFTDIQHASQAGLADGPMHTSTPKLMRTGPPPARRMSIVSPIRQVRRFSLGGVKDVSRCGIAGKSKIPKYRKVKRGSAAGFVRLDDSMMAGDGDAEEEHDTNMTF